MFCALVMCTVTIDGNHIHFGDDQLEGSTVIHFKKLIVNVTEIKD